MDDARIKDMTGGDTLTGRALHSNHFVSFDPTHKLVIAGNNYPIVQDDSHGFWARVVVFPFDVTFTEDQIDKNLEGKLLKELPGILNVVLSGMKGYLANGLQVPDRLTKATQAYRSDQDTIQQFINEECEICIGFTILKKHCYAAYQHWARENGMLPMSSRRFSIRLKKHGISTMSDQRTLSGLKFRPPNEEGPADSQTKCPF
jgi:putative DNA primase/helicase